MNYFILNTLSNEYNKISMRLNNQTETNEKTNEKIPVHIVGNGWASFYFAKNLNKNIYKPIIIAPNKKVLNTPKLVSKVININENVEFDNFHGQIILDVVKDFDIKTNSIILSNDKIEYKYLVLAIGSESNDFGISGVDTQTYKFKTIQDAIILNEKIKLLKPNAQIYIIGSGITGIELACNLAKNNIDKNLNKNLNMIDGLKTILFGYNINTQNEISHEIKMNYKNINMMLDNFVKSIDSKKIICTNTSFDRNNENDLIIWTGGVRINGYKKSKLFETLNKISVEHTNKIIGMRGIEINDNFQLGNLINVYCIGDMVANKGPSSAQNARLHGEWLANYFNNNFESTNKFESNINTKLIHLHDKIYVESKYYKGYLPKFIDNIIEYFYKN